ncbi:glycosyltransferase family 4 protein [Egicoccus sp. AB-alg2]|uniref:glycosyltransferase family 4 protein n=1 Tax=Egicoccus sp. AB-alg2 TaxID=3242693 RepID=UPI00359D45C4
MAMTPQAGGSAAGRDTVVMVVRLFHPWVGGMERQAHKLARGMVAAGVPVELLTGRWFRGTAAHEVLDGVEVTRHQTLWDLGGVRGLRRFSGYLYMLTLLAALWRRRDRCRVVHVHGLSYHTAAAVLAGHLLGVPVVVKLANSGRGSDLTRMRRGDQLAGSRLLVPLALRADAFIALNPRIRDELVAAGVDPARIVDIPNGVDLAPARHADRRGRLRVVYAGRLHANKGLDDLLRAVAWLREQTLVPAFTVDLLGQGPEEDRLRELATSLGLEEVVRFCGPTDDVLAAFARSDVFVLPSRAEGLSNALLEALSVGLPAVVSDLPGNRVVVSDEHDGLVVDATSAPVLGEALARLLEDHELRHRLGEAGRRTVAQRFSTATVVGRYRALYDRVAPPADDRSVPASTPPARVGEER